MYPIVNMKSVGLLASLVLVVASIPLVQAGLVEVEFRFDDPDWSAEASFDNTTGEPWSVDPSFTIYKIVTLSLSQKGTVLFTQKDLRRKSTTHTGGLVMDGTGRVALWILATDSEAGSELDTHTASYKLRLTDTHVKITDAEKELLKSYTARLVSP